MEGGHGTYKGSNKKWYTVADYIKARVEVETAEVTANSLLRILETAGVTAVAGEGLIWILNNAPTELWFTDDTDVDHKIPLDSDDLAGTTTLSGTFELDDNVNYNIQLVFTNGLLTAETIAASKGTGVIASWT